MNTAIKCTHCGEPIEISSALQGQIEEQVLKAARQKHEAELEQVKAEAAEQLKKDKESAAVLARRQLEGEKELLKQQVDAELELTKKKLEADINAAAKKAAAEQELLIASLKGDAESEKETNKQMREQLTALTQELREARKAQENAELNAQKKIAAEEGKIREEATRQADEKQRLNIAAKEKTITDLQKALEEAQRKAAQGSQQLQGEIMELDFETALTNAFRDDDITPVAKGVKGGDIRHTVKSPRGTMCGVMLWEVKRTKNWVDGWIPKLKEDLRNEKANIPIIITEIMPKAISEDIGQLSGVWICKPPMAVVLASLLRKSLLDAGLQKALAQNRGGKADALYNFVTSHEFVQQVEAMVETYQAMTLQITKERTYYAKCWAEREAQAQRLLLGTANIIGSMQGHIGQASMPKIKGLELMDPDDGNTLALND